MLVSCSLDKLTKERENELHDKINQILASQFMVKDNNEFSDKNWPAPDAHKQSKAQPSLPLDKEQPPKSQAPPAPFGGKETPEM